MNIIEVENLCFGYNRRQPVLQNLSFSVPTGAFLAIAGPNGSGKSTLVNLIAGHLKPHSGSIKIDGLRHKSFSPAELARKLALVRQEHIPAFGFTVIETVLTARTMYYSPMGFETGADRNLAELAMQMTDTAGFADRPLGRLSGGERQRVFIARALAQDTPALLLDEPTSFLDLNHQVRIYDLLKKMQLQQSKTIVVVTHDINLARQYCDHVLLLGTAGQYHTGQPDDILSEGNIRKIFAVQGIEYRLGRGKFFLPLGEFSKDSPQQQS